MVTIGATQENNVLIKRLKDMGYFEEEGDVARFAFAYAMKNNLESEYPDYVARNVTTKWAYDLLDRDRLMYSLVSIKYPDVEDVESKVEQLVNLGLHAMNEKIGNVSQPMLSRFIQDVE